MSKYQKFTVETIQRKDIKTASYNPRQIDDENKKRLQKGIQENGLVEPLVWNRRTGNLVSGHQRLAIIDKLERSQNYELDVSVIDVDEQTEKKLNVQLNNTSMQGSFDLDMLGNLALEFEGGLSDLGFSDFDIEYMYGANEKFQELLPDTAAVEATKADIKDIKENRAAMQEKYAEEQSADFYFVVVCQSQEEKTKFLNSISVSPYEIYITMAQLMRIKNKNAD